MGSSKQDNIVIYVSAIALLFVALAARAGEPEKPVTIHGFIDGYYAWNGNDPASHDSFFPGRWQHGKTSQ